MHHKTGNKQYVAFLRAIFLAVEKQLQPTFNNKNKLPTAVKMHVFILGGAIGALVTNAVGEKALLLTLVPLAAVFLIMFIEEEREELEEEISGGRA